MKSETNERRQRKKAPTSQQSKKATGYGDKKLTGPSRPAE